MTGQLPSAQRGPAGPAVTVRAAGVGYKGSSARGELHRQLRALLIIAIVVGLLTVALAETARAACEMTAVEDYNPTGWEGCEAYGTGLASRWHGPGVAVNACTYPWTACEPIRITALDTGRTITVTPTMFCDCWHGTSQAKLVDLDPAAVRALGLRWATGVYRVTVTPARGSGHTLPDTAVQR